MNEKEFVLVSQGIEIFRTKSQENAVNMVKEENDKYFDYLQKCYDNYERPADNYVDLEIEYPYEKEKNKEIERLNKSLEEQRHFYLNQLQQKENIIKEVREWAKKYSCQFTNDDGELIVSEISFNIQARPCDLFKILDKEVN